MLVPYRRPHGSTRPGATGAVKLFRGDAEGALETLRSLPLGIGPAIGAVADFVKELGNVESQLEKIAKVENRLLAIADRRRLLNADAFEQRIAKERERAAKERGPVVDELNALRRREEQLRAALPKKLMKERRPFFQEGLREELRRAEQLTALKLQELAALNELERGTVSGIEQEQLTSRLKARLTAEAAFQEEGAKQWDAAVAERQAQADRAADVERAFQNEVAAAWDEGHGAMVEQQRARLAAEHQFQAESSDAWDAAIDARRDQISRALAEEHRFQAEASRIWDEQAAAVGVAMDTATRQRAGLIQSRTLTGVREAGRVNPVVRETRRVHDEVRRAVNLLGDILHELSNEQRIKLVQAGLGLRARGN